MNYYNRHIGDWLQDTVHLSMIEDGAYSRLADQYYSKERPLPLDRSECYKLARARSKADRDAVDKILVEFFDETPDGYRHTRCDDEIAAYLVKAERNRLNGHKGGRPPNSVRNVSRETQPTAATDGNPEITHAPETQMVSETEPKPNLIQEPVTSSQRKETDLSGKPDPADFLVWYKAYPRHEARDDAAKTWIKRRKELPPLADMLAALDWQKRSGCLRPEFADGRSLIPLPATYLNKGRWKDARPQASVSVPTCCHCIRRAVVMRGGASYCAEHDPAETQRSAAA